MDTGRFLVEVEQEIARLQQVASALRGLSGKSADSRGNGKRTLSTAVRRKMSIAQKARWAKSARIGHEVSAGKAKRTMSAAGRKRIAAAQRARWAKLKNKAA